MKKKTFIFLIILSVLFKFLLYFYVIDKTPYSMVQVDSVRYLRCSEGIINKKAFGRINATGGISYELFRTPGYPAFLAVLRGAFGASLPAIIFIQIVLSLCSAFFVFKTAETIFPKAAKISALLILFDPSSMVYSMMILTETLFMFLLSLFLFLFVKYLNKGRMFFLLLSSVILVSAIYVRPVAYYMFLLVAMSMLFFNPILNIKKRISHTLIFITIIAVLLGVWHYRNINRFGKNKFSDISSATLGMKGLISSYKRNEDMYTQDAGPFRYYISVTTRCFMSLMTRPVSFKYFHSDMLKYAGKMFSYPFITFWIIGLIYGIIKGIKNKYIIFMILMVSYFIVATIVGTMWGSDARFRIPMVPFIAVISSFGWSKILSYKNNNK